MMNRSGSSRGRRGRGGRGRRGQGTGRGRHPNSPSQFQPLGQFQSPGQFRPPQQSHDSFPSDPTPLSVSYGENPPRHNPFPSDPTPSFRHSPPHHSISSMPVDSTPDVHFTIDTAPDPHLTDNPSGSESTFPLVARDVSPRYGQPRLPSPPVARDVSPRYGQPRLPSPPVARDVSPRYGQPRLPSQQMSWQREQYEDLPSEDGMLGKHKRFPDPSSEMGFADDKRIRLDVDFQSQKQEQSADEEGISTGNQAGDTKEEEERHPKDGDPEAKKDSDVPKPSQLSPEDVHAINKKVLMVEGTITHDQYFCSLCYAQLNCRKNLEKHMHANEHLRRIMNLHNSKTFPYFCEVCSCGCPHKEVYEQHLRGKKHLRNTSIVSRKQDAPPRRPLGDLLDELFKESVAQTGDGLSLGMSSHMMKFFSMSGPFIGLQYAEEVGLHVDPNPQYTCTLCSVTVDAANHHLHFTSSAHRLTVLKSDHPEKYSELMRLNLKKSAFSDKLKEMASEIESKEGRKVELIKRKILKSRPGDKFSSDQRSSHSQHPLQKRGTGSVRGRGRGRGQMLPYGGRFSAQSGEFAAGRGAEGDVNRARGRGGRGGGRYFGAAATQGSHMDASKDYTSPSWSQDQQSRRRYGPGAPPLQQQATMASSNFVPIGTSHFVSPTAPSPNLQPQSPSSSSWMSAQPQQPPQVWTPTLQAAPPPQAHPSWTQGPPQAQPPFIQQQPPMLQQPLQPTLQQPPMLQQPPSLVQQPPSLVQQPPSLVQQPPSLVQQPPSLVQQPPSLVQPHQAHPQSWGAHAGNAAMIRTSVGENPSGGSGGPAMMSSSHEGPLHQQQYPHAQEPYLRQQPQSLDNPQGSNNDQVTQLLRNIQGADQDIIQQLSSISSEEDADAALKLSSALTQALLAYRIKSVSTSIPENPLSAVISSLQGLGQLNLQTPTTSSSDDH